MITARWTCKVPFHDVDSMGIVWHGHYVKYLEIARCELLDSFNFGYLEMRESGYIWPVVDMRLKYIKPVTFEQQIEVVATLKEWEHRLKIDYLIRDVITGLKLTKGYTIQVAVDRNGELMLELPPVIHQKLQKYMS